MSIDGIVRDTYVCFYLQLVNTLENILNNIFVHIIKEPCSDEGESI
jgi:hypothetical protein